MRSGAAARMRCRCCRPPDGDIGRLPALPGHHGRAEHSSMSCQYRREPPLRLPPPERSRSCASFTLRGRPSKSVPFSACIAREASALDISTKPKPRGLPVSRSLISETFSTVPCLENRAFTASSVAVKGRFPTYNFVTRGYSKKIWCRRHVLRPGSRSFARVADIGRRRRMATREAKADKPKRVRAVREATGSDASCQTLLILLRGRLVLQSRTCARGGVHPMAYDRAGGAGTVAGGTSRPSPGAVTNAQV